MLQLPEKFQYLFTPHGSVRYRAGYGGRGSGKSHSFAAALVIKARQQPLRVLCAREIQKSIKDSVKRLLDDKIEACGFGGFFDSTDVEIRGANGSLFTFAGLRTNPDTVKSTEGIDIAWLEEANRVSQRSLDILIPTVRKPGSEIWATWNPEFPTDPIDAMFRGKDAPPPRTLVERINWHDNPFFPDVLRGELEWDRKRDPDKYAWVWGGEYQKNSEARVFKNWRVEEFETPDDAVFYLGADWGFSVDPTVLIRCFIKGRTLFIDREAYRVGCEIDNTPALFDDLDPGFPQMARKWTIRADSARPETISYMKRNGYPKIVPALKGPSSVMDGIEFVKTFDIVVHPRCRHVIEELTMYRFKTDPLTNEVLPILEDKKNHCLTGDTLVETIDGPCRIDELVGTAGLVNSFDPATSQHCVREYTDVRKTRSQADIYRLELEDGRHIDLTGDHLVLTKVGWKEVINLTDDDEIIDVGIGCAKVRA